MISAKHQSLRMVALAVMALLPVACGTPPPYQQGATRTQQFSHNAIRYGSIAGAGAGGYFLADELGGGDPFISGLGAAAGVGLAYATHKFFDGKQMEAFDKGVAVGEQRAREQYLNEKWRREAIYGMPPDCDAMANGWDSGGGGGYRAATVRNVYVPSRTVNGVTYPAGNQQVVIP